MCFLCVFFVCCFCCCFFMLCFFFGGWGWGGWSGEERSLHTHPTGGIPNINGNPDKNVHILLLDF